MLIEYSIENFRSIAEKQTFSMVPAKGNSKSYNLIRIDKNKNLKKLLKSAVIFGPNASGKTNVILALAKIKTLVLSSQHMNKGDTFREYQPFELDINYIKRPTLFEISFIKDNIQYKYSFSYNREKIISEELSFFSGKIEKFIFKRNGGEMTPFVDNNELKDLFRYTGENVLFLSKANNEYSGFGPVFEWFNNSLTSIGSLSSLPPEMTIDYLNESDENKIKIIHLLRNADFDIEGLSGKTSIVDDPKILSIVRILSEEVTEKKSEKKDEIQLKSFDIKSIRTRTDGSIIIKDFDKFESAGTKKFLNILGLWLNALEKQNRILIIDEFDSRLHPDLQEYLLKIFHDPEFNKKSSQLIFTTHNTRILSTDFFRRDQIWLTEKGRETKATELYSVFDYEKRHDRSIEKSYYTGRYGALPDIIYKNF